MKDSSSVPTTRYRWTITIFLGLAICANHYVRDSIGALEIQLESDLHSISPLRYSELNSLYFTPNIVTPILGGYLAERYGSDRCLLFSQILSSMGNIIFCVGVYRDSFSWILTGRMIQGITYAVIDIFPVLIIIPMFTNGWGGVFGTIDGFMFFGSILNFIAAPTFYASGGVRLATLVASGVGISGLLFVLLALYYDRNRAMEVKRIAERTREREREDIVSLVELVRSEENTTRANSYRQYFPVASEDEKERGEREGGGSESPFLYDLEEDESFEFGQMTGQKHGVSAITDQIIDEPTDTNSTSSDLLVCHRFSPFYYSYLLSGCFLYGAMVPFMFIGSKLVQLTYNYSVEEADRIVLLPEGVTVVLSIPLGIWLERTGAGLQLKLNYFSLSCLGLLLSYLTLSMTPSVPYGPIIPVLLIGLSYAFCSVMFWCSVYQACDQKHMGVSYGLLNGSLNILPSLVPYIFRYPTHGAEEEREHEYFMDESLLLATLAGLSAVFAYLAARLSGPLDSYWKQFYRNYFYSLVNQDG